MDQALLSGAEQQDKRQRAESGTHKIPSEYEEEFYCVVIEHWAVAQKGSEVSLTGDIQEPPGHNPKRL